MKVQDLFAKIGGLFNACVMIANLILHDYIRFKFRVNYFSFISSFDRNSQLVNLRSSVSKDLVIPTNNSKNKKLKMDKVENFKLNTNENYIVNKKDSKELENFVQVNNQSVAPLLSTQNNLNNTFSVNPIKVCDSKSLEYLEYQKKTSLINTNNKNTNKSKFNCNNINPNTNTNTISKRDSKSIISLEAESKNLKNDNTNINAENFSSKITESEKLNRIAMKDNYIVVENINNNNNNNQLTISPKITKGECNISSEQEKYTSYIRDSNYLLYIFYRMFSCCIKEKNIDLSTKILTSSEVRERYSFAYYLKTITRLEKLLNF